MSELTLFAAGDVVNYRNTSGEVCGPELAKIIHDADYSICNFEAPIHGFGIAQPKVGPNLSQRAETIAGLKRQGFDAILLANNHIMDFGPHGLFATVDAADGAGLATVGAGNCSADAYAPLVIEKNGLRIGIVNACEAQFGVLDFFANDSASGYAWINSPKIDLLIIELKRSCDFVFVFAHAGLEHYRIPQKEWRERYRHFCALGADAVVGAHPHVPQGLEKIGRSFVLYSLGNFYFDSPKYANRKDSTYSAKFVLRKGSAIKFEPVFHYKHDGLVWVADKEHRCDLSALSDALGEGYNQELDAMSSAAYQNIRRNLKRCVNSFPFDRGLIDHLKSLVKFLLKRGAPSDKELSELHLIRNETYYFAAKWALEVRKRAKHEGGV